MNKRGRNRSFSLCNLTKKDRRGTHVGIIISFVIFITFVIFLYVVVQPIINTGEDKGTTIEYLEFKIVENTSANFTSTSVNIKDGYDPETPCIKFQNFFILLSEQVTGFNIITKDENGVAQDVYHENFYHLAIDRDNIDRKFFKIYYSPAFGGLENYAGCEVISEDGYDIGLVKTADYVFKDRIMDLIEYYDGNYEELKENFGISPADEFSFSFIESDGTETEVEQGLTAENVYAEELPVQYIDSGANILSGFINIKVW